MVRKNDYRILSLFSGCGGLDLGFLGGFETLGKKYKRLPTQIIFANDFDIDAATCYNSNPLLTAGGDKCLREDIRNISSADIPDFDILLAGFPCQPFSNAGNRKGIHDNNGRGTLFEECERIIRSKVEKGSKPVAFVFENVRGILSSKMSDGKTTVPQEIQNRMSKLGYDVSIQLVCAADYGVPQMRYRVLIVGIDNTTGKHFDFATMQRVVQSNHIPSLSFGQSEELRIGSIFQNISSIPTEGVWEYSKATQQMVENIGACLHGETALNWFEKGYNLEKLPAIAFQGKSWKDIPPSKLTPRFKRIYDDPKRYHAPKFFRRFAYGEINGTITASAQPENCGITHPVENRRYSVREIARIQSFPDNYHFDSIPLQARYKVIGNAVPPVLGWVTASALIETLNS